MRFAGASSFVLACAFQWTGLAEPLQQPKGSAVIIGVVIDENRAPVARARVQAFSAEDVQKASRGSHRLGRSAGSASTDETGTFRISGLAAGEYGVAAEAIPAFPSGKPVPARVYGPTFYPSTLDVSRAVFLNALDHQPQTVQIELVPVKPLRVTGTVISGSGRSTEGFDVRLFRSFGGFGSGSTVAVVGAKGFFDIRRVPPGAYELIIEPHASHPGQEGREFVDTMIDVKDHDLDLALTVRAGASVIGRVVAEPVGAITTPIGLRVTANKADGQPAAGMSIAAAVNGDWSFRMTVDATHSAAALIEQFRDEKVLWKQLDIAKTIASKHDASVLPLIADWLSHPDRHVRGNVAFIFASLGDPRGLQTIVDILADRSERSEGQGIPTAPGDGRYRFERQVAADRYYAAHLLGDVRDPRGVAVLIPLLDDSETQSIVPWSLGQIGDRRAIPPLIAALDNDDPSNRVLVIYALEALDAKEAIPRLMTLVNDDRKSRFGALVPVSEAAKGALAKLR